MSKPIEPGCKAVIIDTTHRESRSRCIGKEVLVEKMMRPGDKTPSGGIFVPSQQGVGRSWLVTGDVAARSRTGGLYVKGYAILCEQHLRRIDDNEEENPCQEEANKVISWESMADIFIPEEVLEAYDD